MWFFIPIILFLIAICGGYYFSYKKIRFAYTWFFSLLFVFFAWIFFAFLPLEKSLQFNAVNSFLEYTILQYALHLNTWKISLFVFGLILAMMLIQSQYFYEQLALRSEIGFPILSTAISLFILLTSQSLSSLLFATAIFDIIEFAHRVKKDANILLLKKVQLHFYIKIFTFFLIVIYFIIFREFQSTTVIHDYLIIIPYIIAILRSLSSIWIPQSGEKNDARNLNTSEWLFLCGNCIISSHIIQMLLISIPTWSNKWILIVVFSIISLIFLFLWINEKEKYNKLRFFILILINLTFSFQILELDAYSWILTFLLGIVLYCQILLEGIKLNIFSKIFTLYTLSGLPFSPIFLLSNTISFQPENMVVISITYLVIANSIYGLTKLFFANNNQEILRDNKDWFSLLRILGWVVLLATVALMVVRDINQFLKFANYWWIFPIISLIVLLFAFQSVRKNNLKKNVQSRNIFKSKWVSFVKKILDLNWAMNLSLVGYQILRSLSSFIIALLEGQGGLIWGFVLLALLVTMFQTN